MADNFPVWKSEELAGEPQDRRGIVPAMTVEQAAEWLYFSCRRFGATVSTSHKVAGAFADALDQMRQRHV